MPYSDKLALYGKAKEIQALHMYSAYLHVLKAAKLCLEVEKDQRVKQVA